MSGENKGHSGVRPFLRWAGSKRQLLPKIRPFWSPAFDRYVEPFMGSACLFFAIGPRAATLNDLNGELVATFIQVRDNPDPVSDHLASYPISKEFYYGLRAQDACTVSGPEAAARFIYLNRFCFNGLYRTNRQGQFNVPFAPSGTGALPTRAMLRACSQSLRRAKITAVDFADAVKDVRAGDFVYLDPPFMVARRRVFNEYSAKPFDLTDLERLGGVLEAIDRAGAVFVVSYADSTEGRQVLAKWRPARVRTRRNIAGFSKHRKHAYELMATNMASMEHMREAQGGEEEAS